MMLNERGETVRLWILMCFGIHGVAENHSSLKAATLKLGVLTCLRAEIPLAAVAAPVT